MDFALVVRIGITALPGEQARHRLLDIGLLLACGSLQEEHQGSRPDGFFAISRQTVGAVSQGSFTYDLPAAVDCLLEVRSILGEGQQREASRLQASGLL